MPQKTSWFLVWFQIFKFLMMVCIGGAGQDHFCLPQQWIQPYPTYDIYCAAIHWQIRAETFLSTMTWYKFSSLCHFVAVKWISYTIVTWENVIFLWYFCGCQPTFSARLNWSHEILKSQILNVFLWKAGKNLLCILIANCCAIMEGLSSWATPKYRRLFSLE
jgi:hypothetical protein